jgi:hypothetical protein
MIARPGEYLRTRDPAVGRRMLDDLRRYGVDIHLTARETLAVIERHLDVFAPLVVESQSPPTVPGARLQAWFRTVAGPAHRAAMTAALARWLEVTSDSVGPSHGVDLFPADPRARAVQRMHVQATVASTLADWDAREALPALRALRVRVAAEAGGAGIDPRTVLRPVDDALRRLRGLPGEAPIVPDGRGGFRLDRTGAQVVVATVETYRNHGRRFTVLARGEAVRLWDMLAGARETIGVGGAGPGGVRFHFGGEHSVTLRACEGRDELELEGPAGSLARRLAHPALHRRLRRLEGPRPPAPGAGPGAPPEVRFESEHVVVAIHGRVQHVEGLYRFRSPRRAEGFAVRLPAAMAPDLGPPERWTARLTDDRGPAAIELRLDDLADSAIVVPLPARDRTELRVGYRQRLLGRRAVYRLTTARAWGRPLERAVLEVDWPDTLGTPRFSLPFEALHREGGRTRFRFESAPFLPDSDLVVQW